MLGGGATYREVGEVIGCTPTRIYQILTNSKPIRDAITEEKEHYFADIRNRFTSVYSKAAETLDSYMQQAADAPDEKQAAIALRLLDRSGFLPKSDDKLAEDAKRDRLRNALLTEFESLVDGTASANDPDDDTDGDEEERDE